MKKLLVALLGLTLAFALPSKAGAAQMTEEMPGCWQMGCTGGIHECGMGIVCDGKVMGIPICYTTMCARMSQYPW